jgi:uncharacterized membrane protein YeaQ/YmgE (transglycosylase-associated protein family)
MSSTTQISLADSLRSKNTWLVLLVVSAFGLFGGLFSLLVPHEEATAPIWYVYLIMGIVAAITAFWLLRPSEGDGARLVALSFIAGFIGQPIVDVFQARFQAIVAKNDAAKATRLGAKSAELALDDNRRAQRLQEIISRLMKSNPGVVGTVPEEIAKPTQTLENHRKDLEAIAVQLNELRSKYPEP